MKPTKPTAASAGPPEYKPGDKVLHHPFRNPNNARIVEVTERIADIKNGPGFYGRTCDSTKALGMIAAYTPVWGYDAEIVEVYPQPERD